MVGELTQNRKTPDPALYIGEGKLEELKELILVNDANIVVFDNSLSGNKIKNLENALDVKVIDRTMLILDIFARRALSKEGALQVELAQLKYSMPRIGSLSQSSGRFGGGVGMRGPGETKLELDRRVIENKILQKGRELKELESKRDLRRQNRKKSRIFNVALVGYTNSGKSTLLNTLTKSDVLAKDMLFATLDPTTKKMYLGDFKECVITDTVGFVSRLPHELVNAFHSTLEEAVNADLVFHIIDISDSKYKLKVEAVNKTLESLKIGETPVINIYNKSDRINIEEILENDENIEKDAIFISATKRMNLEVLKEKIKEQIN